MLVSYKLNVRVFPFCEVFLLIDNISVHKMPLKTHLLLGREVVRLWLDVLDRKLDRVVDSLDHNQYKDLVEWSSDKAFLPERTNFLGCKGKLNESIHLSVSLLVLF